MYTKYHDESVQKGWNAVMKQKRFYHIPPTAYPIKQQDFTAGISAVFQSDTSIKKFQDELNKLIGAKCSLVSSGRSAMTITLLALKEKKKATKVIIPAYSCSTVLQSVITAELEPVFCDISPYTLDYDRDQLDQIIDKDTLAVIGVHLYGLVQDFSYLALQAERNEAFLIEDAAQCFGGKIGTKIVGTQGDFSIFSLGRGKTLPTNGGGVIASKPDLHNWIDNTLENKITSPTSGFRHIFSLAGYTAAVHPAGWWLIARSWLNPADAGSRLQQLPEIVHKSFSAFQAGFAMSLLKRNDEVYQIWRQNAFKLANVLKKYQFLIIPETAKNTHPVYLRFPIILNHKDRAERLTEKLNTAGIGASRSYRFSLPELYKNSDFARDHFPGAAKLSQQLLTLPTNHFLDQNAINTILQIFENEANQPGS